MKNGLFSSLLVLTNSCFGMTWDQTLGDYKKVLTSNSIIHKQYKGFISHQAPKIADPRIKNIPIFENGEALIDLKVLPQERIQMLPDPCTPFESPSHNSGFPNASKMRAGIFNKLQKMVDALDQLASSFDYESGQINIKVFEALRDLHTQNMLFEKKVQEILSASPSLTLEMAEQEASTWVSPCKNNIPVHSTGAAVDIRLWDNKKDAFLDMGTFGAIWGKNETAPTFSENITDEQKRNRLYCLAAAETAGLTNYVYEFWHFSSGDRYAAWWTSEDPKDQRAIYGAVPGNP